MILVKKIGKIGIIFDIENSEIGTFQSLKLERKLIYQKTFEMKSASYHSIKLPLE